MTKKIRIDIVIFLIIAAILVTAISTAYIINSRVKKISFVQSEYDKLTHIDDIVDAHYIGSIDSEKLSDEIARGYVNGLVDSYAKYYTKEEYRSYKQSISGEYEGIGIQTIYEEGTKNTIISSVSTGSPAGNGGLKVGDRIIFVDEVSIADADYETIQKLLAVEMGKTVTIRVDRGGEEKSCTVTGMEFSQNTVSHVIMGYVGYISISSFNDLTPEYFSNAVDALISQGAKNLIIDVRNNPGGTIESVVSCVDKIVSSGTVATAVYKKTDNEKTSTKVVYEAVTAQEVDLPIVVLINQNTASGGELFAGALYDFGKATLVGDTTFGKGTGQSFYKLPDGSYIKITDMTYFPPSGAGFNLVGVTPSVKVELEAGQTDTSIIGCNYMDDAYILAAFKTLGVDAGILETITR